MYQLFSVRVDVVAHTYTKQQFSPCARTTCRSFCRDVGELAAHISTKQHLCAHAWPARGYNQSVFVSADEVACTDKNLSEKKELLLRGAGHPLNNYNVR